MFKLNSPFQASGDQPQAIDTLVSGLHDNEAHQILMGVTGSGKTFTIANVIQKINRPTLVIAHNKTLAAQLFNEFQEFFPENAVEFFISYYDYYQPEAYLPTRDAYIEKEATVNEEIERLRHSATRSLFLRKDVIIVASVSCIYGLGIPESYIESVLKLKTGQLITRTKLLHALQKIQYERHDFELKQGRYRIKGETIDIFPSWEESLIRLVFFGDEIDSIQVVDPITGTPSDTLESVDIFPATHYLFNQNKDIAIQAIKQECDQQVALFEKQNKLLEANRIKTRTLYDLDMIQEIDYCKGIENYSRHLSGRPAGHPPGVLLDFFREDFLTIIDESHVTVPQIRGMYAGDRSRKDALIQYGFRLPSAKDNRPLTFDEFAERVGQTIYVSATPGPYELEQCRKKHAQAIVDSRWDYYKLAEQIIRPTGLLDPNVTLKPTQNQIHDLLNEANQRIKKNERVLITTLTKKLAEDLCQFFDKKKFKVQYLHSDITTLDRMDILHQLREGKVDILIGVNLLREGLDLPEVSLVAILDADKEGFLRNERALIQTMGRAARHVNGTVILYADKITDSIAAAMEETNRRRELQEAYNKTHKITPMSIKKELPKTIKKQHKKIKAIEKEIESITPSSFQKLIKKLEKDMKIAAENLEFECAAVIRDQIEKLKEKH